MRTLGLTTLLLASVLAAWGQNPEQSSEKAAAEVDAALRARVTKFYDAFISGKFKEAYLLVADDSQDKFFELDKEQYRSCDIDLIQYSGHATQALVITKCKGDWRWEGKVFLVTFPVRSNWALIDGQWYWHYVRPTMEQTPFSSTGWRRVPPDSKDGSASILPKDFSSLAQQILSKVSVDKTSVRFSANQSSQEVVHLRNEMPGEISLTIQDPGVAGLKVSAASTKVEAHQETDVVFAWSPDNPAATPPNATVQLHIEPTNQMFPIAVTFENGLPPAPPQK